MPKAEWDLVVAGAGPGGCALAAKTAATGARVLLLERAAEPGDGRTWIVDIEKTAFEEASVPRPGAGALWKEPEKTVTLSPGGTHVIELPPTPLVPVRNDLYTRQLAGWAEERGAEVRTGARVTRAILEDGVVRGVSAESDGSVEPISANVVADCTGLAGAVRKSAARATGLRDEVKPSEMVVARREIREVDRQEARRAVESGTARDLLRTDQTGTRGAYSVESFYMDIEGGFCDILVGIKPSPGLPTADERFTEIVGGHGFIGDRIFGDGGPIPIRRPLDALVADGIVVLGDSACQVIPVCGSGTASALIAADLASRAVGRALERERYDASALWSYPREFQAGRGSLLAYYDVLRAFTDTLVSDDVEWLIATGLLGAEEVLGGLRPSVFKPGPLALLEKAARGRSRPRLLADFAMVGLKAQKLMKHFRRYPESYSEAALERWIAGIPRY